MLTSWKYTRLFRFFEKSCVNPDRHVFCEPVMKIALISPKGPLYRHRGGIFKQSLRYMPLTFPTLVALIPDDIPAEVVCYDEVWRIYPSISMPI